MKSSKWSKNWRSAKVDICGWLCFFRMIVGLIRFVQSGMRDVLRCWGFERLEATDPEWVALVGYILLGTVPLGWRIECVGGLSWLWRVLVCGWVESSRKIQLASVRSEWGFPFVYWSGRYWYNGHSWYGCVCLVPNATCIVSRIWMYWLFHIPSLSG